MHRTSRPTGKTKTTMNCLKPFLVLSLQDVSSIKNVHVGIFLASLHIPVLD